jgi:hypothetical protein
MRQIRTAQAALVEADPKLIGCERCARRQPCPAFGIASERLASEACEALRAAAAARAVTRP